MDCTIVCKGGTDGAEQLSQQRKARLATTARVGSSHVRVNIYIRAQGRRAFGAHLMAGSYRCTGERNDWRLP
jgi:hypothetical protein